MQHSKRWIAAATVAVAGFAAPSASAETFFGITDDGDLVGFDSQEPGTLDVDRDVTGLANNERIVAIDVRPATLQLYGVSSLDRLYRIDTATGAATAVGGVLPLNGANVDIDFNPTVDRLRVVSDAEDNLRVNPGDGAVVADKALTGPGEIAGAAYTNNAPTSSTFPAAPTTQLLDIDTSNDSLYEQTPPNEGTVALRGPLGVDVVGDVGFDIATASTSGTGAPGNNNGFAVMRPVSDSKPRLYTIDLTTGTATAVGQLPADDPVRDLAVAPDVPTLTVLLDNPVSQTLVAIRADRPGSASTPVAVSGLGLTERLVAIDRRPGGALFGVSTASRVYEVDADTGETEAIGTAAFTPALTGTSVGVDFNPVVDRLRLVSDADQNLRINQLDGTAAEDKPVAYEAKDPNAGDDPELGAVAYTNSITPAPATTVLYGIEAGQDTLVRQEPPDEGVLTTLGTLGVDAGAQAGYDIVPRFNQGFAALRVGVNANDLYAIEPGLDPVAVRIGAIGVPNPAANVRGLAVRRAATAPIPTPDPTVTPTPTATPGLGGGRPAPTLTAKVKPKRDTTKPFKFKVSGQVKAPAGVDAAAACTGKVRITAKRRGQKLGRAFATVADDCRYKGKVKLVTSRSAGKAKLFVRFGGNTALKPAGLKRKVAFGG